MILNILFFAAAACAQMRSPYPPTLDGMRQEFLETTDALRKTELREKISAAVPSSSRDVQALFDLFSRFPEKALRGAVMDSIHRLKPQDAHLDAVFLYYLNDKEPASQLFGINGALAIRAEKALPVIEKLAKGKFSAKSPEELELLSEKNEWWVRYEALSALARWRGAATYPLLKQQAAKAPLVAKIIGANLWSAAFPQILAWARSSSAADLQRAQLALTADADPRHLRDTRAEMIRIVHNFADNRELRHQLALKIGLSSTEEEVAELVKEHDQSQDSDLKLFLAASIFASRSRLAVPLLKHYALEKRDPTARLGALVQLREMLPVEEYLPILEIFAKKDPDPENKEDAARQLRVLRHDKK